MGGIMMRVSFINITITDREKGEKNNNQICNLYILYRTQ